MKAIERLKSSPMWFVAPSLLVALAIGATMAGYNPLLFDPSLYPTQSALASELTQVDADALEGKSSDSVGGIPGIGKMEDGTWTGYAACGEGNTDDWKPYYVSVTIEVKDNKVTAITDISGTSSAGEGSTPLAWDAAENQEYLDRAIDGRGGSGVRAQMEDQIAESGAVSSVDTVSGATYSSTAIYNALVDAMRKAAGDTSVPTAAVSAGKSGNGSKKVDASATKADLADGVWTGYAACGKGNTQNWKPYYVAVTVKVKGGKVADIAKVAGSSTGESGQARLSWDASENQKYLNWAASGHNGYAGVKTQMDQQIAKAGKVTGVDTVSGATYSSEAIYEAYANALAKSAKAVGSKAKTKVKKPKKPRKQVPETIKNDTNVGALADGTWTAYAKCGPDPDQDWKPYYVGVTLTVTGGKPASLDRIFGSSAGNDGDPALEYDAAENDEYLQGAISVVGTSLKSTIASGEIPSRVDTVSGATYSSKSINEALFAALRKSAAAAGSSIDEPSGDGDDGKGEGDSSSDNSQGSQDPGEGDNEPAGEVTVHSGYALCESTGSDWDSYYIFVEVNAVNGVVTKINRAYGDAEGVVDPGIIYSASENATYLNWAIDGKFGGTGYRMKSVVKQIQEKLDAGAAVSGIQTVSGATRSSRAIIAAYENAVASL